MATLAALTALSALTLKLPGLESRRRRAALKAGGRPTLTGLSLSLPGLESRWWRAAFEARRRPALARLPTACAALTSLLISGRAARGRLGATRSGTCAGRPANLTALACLTTLVASRRARGLGCGSGLRLGLRRVRHHEFAGLKARDYFDEQPVAEARLYDAATRRSVRDGHKYQAASRSRLHGGLGHDDHVARLGDQDLNVRGQACSEVLVGRIREMSTGNVTSPWSTSPCTAIHATLPLYSRSSRAANVRSAG